MRRQGPLAARSTVRALEPAGENELDVEGGESGALVEDRDHAAQCGTSARRQRGPVITRPPNIAIPKLDNKPSTKHRAVALEDVTWATGDSLLLTHAAWRPPLGWLPWLGLACVGSLAIAAAPAFSDRIATSRAQRTMPHA
jgi:hypothetical protein